MLTDPHSEHSVLKVIQSHENGGDGKNCGKNNTHNHSRLKAGANDIDLVH